LTEVIYLMHYTPFAET